MKLPHQFEHHYTLAEARALLPRVQAWLVEIRELQKAQDRAGERNAELFAEGRDLGGERINEHLRALAKLHSLFAEFQSREIQLKDLDCGLLDFPSLRGDREVLLCWKEGEEDIEFWHDLESGYAGREPL
ncbi:MAG TPA: DUF2203 domain-containing protein [Candidatus Limnocylindria bacterium]|nr:DUF2203 domain-containing protein [Candidatus Limnocylindria bacterium]